MIDHGFTQQAVVANAWGDASSMTAAGRQRILPKACDSGVGRLFSGSDAAQMQLYDTVGRRFLIGTTIRLGAR